METTPEVRKVQNVIFAEERTTHFSDTRLNNQVISNAFADMAISDDSWRVTELTQRTHFVSQYTWATSDTYAAQLLQVSIPNGLFNQCIDSSMNYIMKLFSFLRTALALNLSLPGTRYHLGQLIMVFKPFDLPFYSLVSVRDTIFQLSGWPAVFMEASQSKTNELIIPHTCFQTYLNIISSTRQRNIMGSVQINVFNPLNTTSTSPASLTGSLFFRLIQPDLKGPTQYHTNYLPETAKFTNDELDDAANAIIAMSKSEVINKESVKLALVKVRERNVEQHGLGDIIKNGIGGAIQGGLASGSIEGAVLGALQGIIKNLDHPTTSERTYLRTHTNLALGEGGDSVDNLNLFRDTGYFPLPSMTGATNEMDLLALRQKPMLMHNFSVSSTDNVGDIKFSSLVHPGVCRVLTGSSENYHDVQMTYLGYTTSPFLYWRGSLKYDFQFVTSTFHTGQFVLIWRPAVQYLSEAGAPALTINDFSSLNMLKIDIAERSIVSFTVPMMNERDMYLVHSIVALPNNLTTGYSSRWSIDVGDSATKDRWMPAANGDLTMIVLQPLRNSLGLPGSIDVNVFIRAGDDYETFKLGQNPQRFSTMNSGDAGPLKEDDDNFVEVEQHAGGDESADVQQTEMATEMALNQDQGPTEVLAKQDDIPPPIGSAFFHGERYTDLRDIIRTYGYVYVYNISKSTPFISTAIKVTPSMSNPPCTWMSYFARIFGAWSGSIRWKFATDADNVSPRTLYIVHQPDFYSLVDINSSIPAGGRLEFVWAKQRLGGYRHNFYNLCTDKVISVNVPYAQSTNFLYTRGVAASVAGAETDNGILRMFWTQGATVTNDLNVDIYAAAGDDFMFIFPTPPPVVNLQNAADVTTRGYLAFYTYMRPNMF